jgi:CSLREA domain-containing protein
MYISISHRGLETRLIGVNTSGRSNMMKRDALKTEWNGKGKRTYPWTVFLVVSVVVVGSGLFLTVSSTSVQAKTFAVNSTLDETDTNPGDGVCVSASGYCTLRAAVQETNALAGPDIIKLKTGLYMLTIAGISEDGGASGDLDITGDLAIIGAGAKKTFINGGKLDRVFHIISSTIVPSLVTFTDLTIQNGLATDGGPSGEAVGGGIFNHGSTLEIIASTISNNTASGPGNAFGGGIYNERGWVIIKQDLKTNIKSKISNNVARGGNNGSGGGISAEAGTVTMIGSTLSDNSASGPGVAYGGGISNYSAVTITESTLSNNSASGITVGNGGGIYNHISSSLTLQSESKIVRNFASDGGGGIYSDNPTEVIISPDSSVTNNIPNDKNF